MEERDYYTYQLSYPESMGGSPFYVGMGSGNRIDQHEKEARKGVVSEKCDIIRAIWAQDEEVVKTKVDEGLTWSEGLIAETALIRKVGFESLANRAVSGRGPGKGNTNRVIPKEQRKRGRTKNISMPYKTWEQFKTASDLCKDGPLTEERYMELWGDLCDDAIREFIKQYGVRNVQNSSLQ